MKRVALKFILLSICTIAYPQYDISEYYSDTSNNNDYYYEEEINPAKENKLKFSVETGVSFTSINKNEGTIFGNYVSPVWHYQFTPRFRMSFGTIFLRQNYSAVPAFYSSTENASFSGIENRAIVFASGTYQLSRRLSITGTGYKEVGQVQKNRPSFNPYMHNYLYQGMSMEINYRLTDNMHIGAGITITEGSYSPYSLHRSFIPPFVSNPTAPGFINPW